MEMTEDMAVSLPCVLLAGGCGIVLRTTRCVGEDGYCWAADRVGGKGVGV